MRSVLLLSLLVIALFNVSAQSDFRPGYVITNSFDTIQGFVDYRGEIRSMKVCTFKESMEAPSKEFLPGNIYGYRFNTGKFFVSKEINTKELNDTVFVEFLLKGISNLYYYAGGDYNAYFLESEDAGLLELKSTEVTIEKNGLTYVSQDNRYLGVLSYALSDIPEVKKEIAQTELSHKSLIQLTRKYHDYKCSDEACVIYEKKLPLLRVELRPIIGYSFSNISFQNLDPNKGEFDFPMSSSPFVGLGFNLIVPRWNEKLTFLVNIAFNKDHFSASNYYFTTARRSLDLNNSNLISSFLFKYTYPKNKLRPEVFGGLYSKFLLKSDARYTYERLVDGRILENYEIELFKRVNFGFTGGVGVEYKILNKLNAFSNVCILHGAGFQRYSITSKFTSYRISAGLVF